MGSDATRHGVRDLTVSEPVDVLRAHASEVGSTCHDSRVLRPFVAYLRVYEPLSAFGDPPDPLLRQAADSAQLTRGTAGEREQFMWLKSQTLLPYRLLPAELPNGDPAPSTKTDVLVLDPADVPEAANADLGPGRLVCPLELRARSAAALVGFLGEANPALRQAALADSGFSVDALRSRTNAALNGLRGPAVHVLSTTWSVPLPWFALIDPAQRKFSLGTGRHDPEREVSWRATIVDARRRVDDAKELVDSTMGDSGPAKILDETKRWLDSFDDASAVELDYGGLVQLIADPMLESDSSAEDVHRILAAMRAGDFEQVTEIFQGVRDYWAELAAKERFN